MGGNLPIVAIFGTSGGARLRGGRSARGSGRSPAGVAVRTLQLEQARLSTIPVPPTQLAYSVVAHDGGA
jgi:hypothetical protein